MCWSFVSSWCRASVVTHTDSVPRPGHKASSGGRSLTDAGSVTASGRHLNRLHLPVRPDIVHLALETVDEARAARGVDLSPELGWDPGRVDRGGGERSGD